MIRKFYLTLVCFFAITFSLRAQCNGNITLSSQSDVDSFSTTYGCTTISGYLTISGNDITNLDGLSGITNGGYLQIINNPVLNDISGLHSMTSTVTLNIENNPHLTSIDGLSALRYTTNLTIGIQTFADLTGLSSLDSVQTIELKNTRIGSLHGLENVKTLDTFNIAREYTLASLEGLSGLTTVGEFYIQQASALRTTSGTTSLQTVTGQMIVYDNYALTDLHGFGSVTSVKQLRITENQELVNVDSLSALTTSEELTVSGNTNLIKGCGFYNVLTTSFCDTCGRTATFSGNAVGITAAEIVAAGPCQAEPSGCDRDVTLDSQADVDRFGCAVVHGTLIISGPDITNVDSLAGLTKVSKEVQIINNPVLTNLDGLSSLTVIGSNYVYGYTGLDIDNNARLTSIHGLRNLDSIAGLLHIRNNDALQELDGFEKVRELWHGLIIDGNDALTNINGLSSLRRIVGVTGITSNSSLQNLDGFRSLTGISDSPGATFRIADNTSLTNVDSLSALVWLAGPARKLVVTGNTSLTNACGFYNLISINFCEGCPGDLTMSNNGPGVTKEAILAAGPCGSEPPSSTPPTNIAFSNVTDNSMTVSFAAGSGYDGYITLMRSFESSLPDEAPEDGTQYHVGNVIGCCSIVVGMGTDTTLNIVYLEPDIDYYFDIIPYSGSYEYSTDMALSGNQRTSPQVQPYPNPFVEEVVFPVTVSEENANVRIMVMDQLGRIVSEVVNDTFVKGEHEIRWSRLDVNGNRAVSGVYMYSIVTNESAPMKGMFVAK